VKTQADVLVLLVLYLCGRIALCEKKRVAAWQTLNKESGEVCVPSNG
jgi:hypothetical protein